MSYQLPNFLTRGTGDSATAAANTAVVLTYAAMTGGQKHALVSLTATYSVAPTTGGIKVEDGSGNVIFQADITVVAPAPIQFAPPMAGSPNTALIITLAAGGGSSVGKLNAGHLIVE